MSSGAVDPQQTYLSQLEVIEGIIRFVIRRHRVNADEAEEFAATVRLRLVEDDFAILRQFQGRSSLRTYLGTVVQRLFLDFRMSRWGKWRPSAVARRAGPMAVRLETLVSRDGLSFEEAVRVMTGGNAPPETLRELEALRAQLPERSPVRFLGEDGLEQLSAPSGAAESLVANREGEQAAARTREALASAVAALPPRDRLMLTMLYRDGFSVADVGRVLQVPQKPLYRRREEILERLREDLSRSGVEASDVVEWLGRPEWDLGLPDIWEPRESRLPRPSLRKGAAR